MAKCEIRDSILKGFKVTLQRPLTLLRAGGIGAFVGVLPALGVSVAGIASYLIEKKYSKEASQFGKGAPAGVVAAEAGKGACVVGDLIPTFTLGVPGSVTGAILLAALIMLGIEPGPKFLLSGSLPYTVFAGILLAQASFLISGLVMGKWLCRVTLIPSTLLAPILTVLVFLGAYAERNFQLDILLALAFGLFGYALGKVGYPVVCFILGLILGPIVEANFHRSLGQSFGSYSVFITRPMSVVMLAITVLFLLGPYLLKLFRGKGEKSPSLIEEAFESGAGYRGTRGEVLLLFMVAFILSAFMITARKYGPLVRLFPTIVTGAGLGFAAWRLLAIAFHIFSAPRLKDHPSSAGGSAFFLYSGRLPWHWSAAAMVAYAFSVYLFGFFVASGLYVATVILVTMGYQKWRKAVLAAVLTGLGVWLFAKTVHLLFLKGLLTGI